MDRDSASRKRRSDPEHIPEKASAAKRFRASREEELTVKASIEQFRRTFPLARFNYTFPPAIFRHQLYSVLPNRTRTEIDREVNFLRLRHEVKCFQMDARGDELIIVKTEDYREHVRGYARDHSKNHLIIEKFLDHTNNFDISITTADLTKDRVLSEEDIQTLVKLGVLVLRDVGSWWFSFPGAGQFMKAFTSGREKIIMMVKKAKYSTVLESELIHRGLPKRCLGVHYAVHDVIGCDLVETSTTTSGRLLRHR